MCEGRGEGESGARRRKEGLWVVSGGSTTETSFCHPGCQTSPPSPVRVTLGSDSYLCFTDRKSPEERLAPPCRGREPSKVRLPLRIGNLCV